MSYANFVVLNTAPQNTRTHTCRSPPQAFRNRVASVPEVKAIYDAATDDIRVGGFRADAA
jgi:hypothetical protein